MEIEALQSLDEAREIKDEAERVAAIYRYFQEERRLQDAVGRVEFLTTLRYIEAALRPGDRVLDLGAGTGAYSLHLARQAYPVTALELSERNVECFRAQIEAPMNIQLMQGNALNLSAFADQSFDVVLLFGPLYHLASAADRERCLSEARRVLKAGGTLFAAFIHHDMIHFTESHYDPEWWQGSSYQHDDFRLENFPFVFFTIDECRQMLNKNALQIEKEIASDGLAELLGSSLNRMSEASFNQYLRYHWTMCEKKELLGASNHLLFQCKKSRTSM